MADQEEVSQVVDNSDRVAVRSSGAPASVVAQRVVWYVVGFVIALLALRVVLLLFGANRVGFVDFVYSFSGIFSAPFANIFATPSYDGKFYLDSASLVAIVIYGLVGWGVAKLFTLGSNRV